MKIFQVQLKPWYLRNYDKSFPVPKPWYKYCLVSDHLQLALDEFSEAAQKLSADIDNLNVTG